MAGPIFVIGAPRSGTTAMSVAVHHVTGYYLKGEGHVWPLLPTLQAAADGYISDIFRGMGGNNDFELYDFKDVFHEGLVGLFKSYYSRHGQRWIDKTPDHGMIGLAPDLLRIYPDARFILMKRHPIDALNSMARKFRNTEMVDFILEWRKCYENWLNVRDALGDRFVEVDQSRMYAGDPEVARAVTSLIGLDEAAAEAFTHFSVENRHIEQTELKSGKRTVCLKSVDWPEHIREEFERTCRDISGALGYDLDQEFLIDFTGQAVSLFLPLEATRRAMLANGNKYCYPIRGGLQLTANAGNAPATELQYTGIPSSGLSCLKFEIAREFENGPELLLTIVMRDKAGEVLLNEKFYVTSTEKRAVELNFKPASSVELDIRLTVPKDDPGHYGSVHILNPMIT